jgi:putative flippase GtrA
MMKLAVLYALLAAIATAANIGSQEVVVQIYQGAYALMLSVAVGTGVGLVAKYLLDKRFIFRFQARSAVHETRTFLLYAFTGVFTTLIFWGFEFGFDYLFQSKEGRYLGGILGLAIGYVTKYQMDRRFVFGSIAGRNL